MIRALAEEAKLTTFVPCIIGHGRDANCFHRTRLVEPLARRSKDGSGASHVDLSFTPEYRGHPALSESQSDVSAQRLLGGARKFRFFDS